MNPPESQKAMAISHGISLAKALKAAAKVMVLVSIAAPRPSIATAPRGRGEVMIPAMVATKIDSRCHALTGTPAGAGMNHITAPMATHISRDFMSAPHLKAGSTGAGGSGAAGAGDAAGVEAARTDIPARFGRRGDMEEGRTARVRPAIAREADAPETILVGPGARATDARGRRAAPAEADDDIMIADMAYVSWRCLPGLHAFPGEQ
mmetsp:Transcript_20254/g.56152  ORF Transcript_20254/g.56152 Transcript_20254/m.56152 type:complete len:207 (-) Transcript_20254:45-665(-)